MCLCVCVRVSVCMSTCDSRVVDDRAVMHADASFTVQFSSYPGCITSSGERALSSRPCFRQRLDRICGVLCCVADDFFQTFAPNGRLMISETTNDVYNTVRRCRMLSYAVVRCRTLSSAVVFVVC
jgi:hypothetical protein